ncbi:MAG: barstar family protein [Oscillospiraceae bacterium]|nr:barstar family protein [Oscillospiraceae bacterium]
MNNLDLKQGYLAMFYLLDEHYWKTTKNDSLAMVLGFLSPFTFIDSMSADPACWIEWQETVKKITNEDSMTSEEVLKASIKFLEIYSNDFFQIGWVIDALKKLSPESDIWINYIKKALGESIDEKITVPEKIIIDFAPCKSIDDVRSLLKENLNLSDWNDINPDGLLKQLKELNQCKIYFRGINLVSDDIAEYMKQVIEIFRRVEEMYKNIRVYVMNVVTIDFTEVKSVYEAHKLISEKLAFPDWYGGNLDALWDLLTRYIPPYEIRINGINAVHEYVRPALQKIVDTFQEAEAKYNYHKIINE